MARVPGTARTDVVSTGVDPRREFRRQVELNVTKSADGFAQLIKLAKMGPSREDAYMEGNKVKVLTSTMTQASEQLLVQIEQLKRIYVLQDFEALNKELDDDIKELDSRRQELQKEIERWTSVLRDAYNRQLNAER